MNSFILELDSQLLDQSVHFLHAEPSTKAFGTIEHAWHTAFSVADLEGQIRTSCPKCWKAFPSFPF
jgi:hypothetical protein